MNNAVKKALEGLEEVAKHGRAGWEMLFNALEESEQKEEIHSFLSEWIEETSN